MPRVLLGSTLAVFLLLPAGVIAQSPPRKGTPISFSGCVRQGTRPDSFIMFDVKRTDGIARDPNTVYWLDSPRKVAEHSGQLVEVTGTISSVDAGKIKVKVDPKKAMDTTIAVERGTNKAEVELDTKPVGTSGHIEKVEEPRVMIKVNVASLRVLSDSCTP